VDRARDLLFTRAHRPDDAHGQDRWPLRRSLLDHVLDRPRGSTIAIAPALSDRALGGARHR